MAAQSGRQPSTSIFIGNVGFSANEEELSALFKQAGPLKSFRLVTDRETGKPKGYAFAEYFDIPTAQSAQRNLNGMDVNGRSLRVDFADSEKHSSDHKGPQKPIIVGKEAAVAAGQTMAAALGGQGGAGQQQISDALSKMTRPQIFEIMNQMKALIQQNPVQARQILVQNPQLTKALFQAQILLGMVSPPPVAAAPQPQAASQTPAAQPQQPPQQLPAPVQLPAPGQPASQQAQYAPQQPLPQQSAMVFPQQPGFQAPGQPGGLQPQQQPVMQQASYPQQQPLPRPQTLPPPIQGPRPYSGPQGQPIPAPRTLPAPGTLPTPPAFALQHPIPQQPQQVVPADPRQQPQQPIYDPRQQPPMDPRQQVPQQRLSMDPRQAVQDTRLQAPQDPRQQGPRPQMPQDPRQVAQPGPSGQQPSGFQGGFPQPQAAPMDPRQQQAQGAPVLGQAEQQALLRQVMSLTPQQIDLLPEAQRQQVLDLQRQLRGQVMPS